MRTILSRLRVPLALVAISAPAIAAEKPENVLVEAGLRRVGELYLLKSEDQVKEADAAVDQALQKYRAAGYMEKQANLEEERKKGMAEELTKQRSAMGEELAQALPEVRAQIQALNQQRAALRQQMNSLQYSNTTIGVSAYNEVVDRFNAIGDQIDVLQTKSNQYVMMYNNSGDQVRQLRSKKKGGAVDPKNALSVDDCREGYAKALLELRKRVDETKDRYAAVAKDAGVTAALESLNQRSTRIKYTLGPSKKFQEIVKSLAELEAKGTAEAPAGAAPGSSSKVKKKALKRK